MDSSETRRLLIMSLKLGNFYCLTLDRYREGRSVRQWKLCFGECSKWQKLVRQKIQRFVL